jgi:hypothetical protein
MTLHLHRFAREGRVGVAPAAVRAHATEYCVLSVFPGRP